LLPEFLPPEVRKGGAPAVPESDPPGDLEALIETCLRNYPGQVHEKVLEVVERTLFIRALRHTGGHQTRASELLGINRATLRTRLRALGVAIDRVLVEDADRDG
jgi:two-component system nitrogen regulation response regulator GlnG